MKALRFSKTGDLKFLELVEQATPRPGDGEGLVRVKAAGLNPSDVSNVLGKHPYTTLPRTPGRDFSGVVAEGPEALVGQEIWGTGKELGFTRDGSHAEYLVLPADAIAVKPKSLSFSQAASCGVPFVTAWSGLESVRLAQASKLLVVGAAGAVGSAVLAVARWRGASVAGAVRRSEQASALDAQGIASIVLPEDKSLAEAVKRIFPDGADIIFDTTGAWLRESVCAIAPLGRIAVIVAPPDGEVTVSIRDLYRRGGSIVGVDSRLYSANRCAQMLARIGEGFDSGGMPAPSRLQERPLASAVDAYVEASKKRGAKVVFVTS